MKQFSFKRKLESCRNGDETDTEDKDDTKRKSRNLSEKKRRDQFNILISELSYMVSTNSRRMDKSSILKSTIAFLKNHNEITTHRHECSDETWKPSFLGHEEFTHLMLEALDAFILVLSVTTGKIIYMSENVTSLLGYPTNDSNLSIFDVIHDNDKHSFYELLQNDRFLGEISLSLHVKHGSLHMPNIEGFEAIRVVGSFLKCNLFESSVADEDSNSISSEAFSSECQTYFVALARFCSPQLLLEMTICDGFGKEFVSKHSLEWKFLFLDHRASPIIGYLPFEVLGTSVYDYYHVDDLDKVASSHETLMQTGEGTSCFYRFLTKGQQWIWLQTRCYITYHQWNSKPEFVVCTHNVFGYDRMESSLQKKSRSSVNENTPRVDKLPRKSPSVVSKASVSSRRSGVSSVLSTVHLSQATNSSVINESDISCSSSIQNQTELVISDCPVVASPFSDVAKVEQTLVTDHIQTSNYQYLQWRHQQLQEQILVQQEELRRISQQLLEAQFALPETTPMMPLMSAIPSLNHDGRNEDPGNTLTISTRDLNL